VGLSWLAIVAAENAELRRGHVVLYLGLRWKRVILISDIILALIYVVMWWVSSGSAWCLIVRLVTRWHLKPS